MFNLLPKDAVFYDLFENIADHVVCSARNLHEMFRDMAQTDRYIRAIRNEEHAADELAHTCLDRLDRTFITPFDREDIHELVGGMDDIIDGIDALAKRVPLFHIRTVEPEFLKQTDVLLSATQAVSDAVHRLRHSRKLSDLRDKLIEIHHHESIGDDNHHSAMYRLFDGSRDALDVIKWKQLYDYIEEAIDNCEDVGNTLERIVLKNG